MNTYFDNELTYLGLTVYFGNNPNVSEREIHTYYEVMLYMDDKTDFFTENGQRRIKNNTLLIIPKETYHFFKLPESKNFLRVKISIPDSLIKTAPLKDFMSKMKIIDNPDENIISLFDKLQVILKEKCNEKRDFYAYSVVLFLLSELNFCDFNETNIKSSNQRIITYIIDYISNHISEDLSIDTISKKTNYSPSNITHCFKKELGVSIHKYISMRRLIHARNLILNGMQISKVHLSCGYNDYSAFYKAYSAFFGYPPSKEKH